MKSPLSREEAIKAKDVAALIQDIAPDYELTRRFVCKAGETGAAEMPAPSEADFLLEEYNIEYEVQNNGAESLYLRFKNLDSGRAWSNDLIPARSISTPGARIAGNVRYGSRKFTAFLKKNSKLSIEWKNEAAQDLTVWVTFKGKLFYV